MRGWHISRSQPKVCMTISDNRKTAGRFTRMERKQSRSRHLLEKNQTINPWSKSHKV
ncbi:unnamed protein product [Brassica napus]|uniref:(rape) hypothetical protein n=1 Tax=Brassica napus TaxID=3708 RepID=A0A816SNE3_BRANA|nr:unnamed protein product [Brassica napus]